MSTGLTDHEFSRADKLARIAALGIDPWGGRFDGHRPIAQIRELPCPPFDDNPTERVRAAGRIVLRRIMGKIHFLQLRDRTGEVQVMLGQKQVGEVGWQLAQELDLGDLIGAEGIYGKTRTGEPTIRADKLTFLAKSLEPHPDKHAGIKDEEFRVRHRYLDLVYNADSLRRTTQRVAVVRALRTYLDGQGFMEVETPTLHAIAGGRRRGRSSRTTTRSTSTCTCGSHWSCTSSACWSAGWSGSTRSAGSSATRASAAGTIPSSPCWSCTRRTATTTA